ncbi:MAG: hypothetical protein HRK26_05185 [Rickettsiaceae bacterium H1]|nr:hypothetical protein [Rickettsiaceae bacterium H1]
MLKSKIVIFVITFSVFLNAKEKCDLYPRLHEKDCNELCTIQENYYKYDEEFQKVALLRAKEIKLNLLEENEKIDMVLHKIDSIKLDYIPINIVNDIVDFWKLYCNLSVQSKKETIKYSLGIKKVEQLEELLEYIENKTFFIAPKIKREKSS